MFPEFTPRNVAKFVVKTAIGGVVARQTEQAITEHTSLEEDAIVVDIAGGLVGWYVSDKLKPYTDQAVDKTADWIAEKRESRRNKKDNPEEK